MRTLLPLPPALLATALAAAGPLAACTSPGAQTAAAPVATPMPPRTPAIVCLGCGTISAREPGELPRWKYRVQMDDGTESIVFQERADWLVVGARVRVAGGQLQQP
jgi:hypothetical protein